MEYTKEQLEKAVKRLTKTACRWNVSNIYEPDKTEDLKWAVLKQAMQLAIKTGEWKKWNQPKK